LTCLSYDSIAMVSPGIDVKGRHNGSICYQDSHLPLTMLILNCTGHGFFSLFLLILHIIGYGKNKIKYITDFKIFTRPTA